MYHIYQRCLSRTATHLMLQCHPQMSGTDSGPSAVTMKKWSRKQRQGWQKKENLRRQREKTAHAAEGAARAGGAQNPGVPHSDTCQLPFAASSPRTPAIKQTRRDSPGSPSSPNPSDTKRREHDGDIAPVPGVEEESQTVASGNQATTLVAAKCTGANADGTARQWEGMGREGWGGRGEEGEVSVRDDEREVRWGRRWIYAGL